MDELTIELRGCFTGNTSDDMEVGDEDWDTGSLDGEYDFSAATTTTSTTATEVIVATKEVLSEEEDLELLVVYKHSTGGGGDPQAESMLEERVRVSSNATLTHLLKKLKVAFDLPKIDESALELSDYDPVTQQVPHSLPPRWLSPVCCNDALTWSQNGVTTRVYMQQVGHPYRSWVTLSNRLRDEFIDNESAFLLEVPLLLSTHTHTHTHTTHTHLDCVRVWTQVKPQSANLWFSNFDSDLALVLLNPYPRQPQFCSLPGACRSIDAPQVLLVFEVLPTSSEGSTTEGTSARLPPPISGVGTMPCGWA
jgi:hypothetical protein